MSARTLTIKLKPNGAGQMPVSLFFKTGDWAVTQGLCVIHSDKCLKVTHIPSTHCIPPCLHDLELASNIARRINAEVPKFKAMPRPHVRQQYSRIFKDEIAKAGAPLELPIDHYRTPVVMEPAITE